MLKQVVELKAVRTVSLVGTASTIMYVVPAGRVFNGTLVAPATNAATLSINGGGTAYLSPGSSDNIFFPISLIAGDTLLCGAGTTYLSLIGVESWL